MELWLTSHCYSITYQKLRAPFWRHGASSISLSLKYLHATFFQTAHYNGKMSMCIFCLFLNKVFLFFKIVVFFFNELSNRPYRFARILLTACNYEKTKKILSQ